MLFPDLGPMVLCDYVPHAWHTETAPFVAYTHLPLVQGFADQHSKLIMRNAGGPPLAHEIHLAVRPASGPCRTARGQRVRRGGPQTSWGEWDVRRTELDPGVSFPERG
jgi:hypothetical protein